ncbi:MAG: hypothetical protein KIH08_15175 [Candidatus Freyarchaeota archaeon]|nr:hypothetical protein [Candidatus Jordarchaeia archaeon]MBS7270140.1 hypothetical protein [Candidatus Jordarchaeia archaeon]MBS7281435.1 hypothetical protein [Candidatus Jordarchaeia archaeon]
MQVGSCGICCDACGLGGNLCSGCMPGSDPSASKKVKFLKSINALFPVLDCAVKKENSLLFKKL